MSEHAVIVYFKYGINNLEPFFKLEEELLEIIGKSNVGEYDGNEIADDNSEGSYYMYGPDADKLFSTVEPVLRKAIFLKGAKVLMHYGSQKEKAPETILTLNP